MVKRRGSDSTGKDPVIDTGSHGHCLPACPAASSSSSSSPT